MRPIQLSRHDDGSARGAEVGGDPPDDEGKRTVWCLDLNRVTYPDVEVDGQATRCQHVPARTHGIPDVRHRVANQWPAAEGSGREVRGVEGVDRDRTSRILPIHQPLADRSV